MNFPQKRTTSELAKVQRKNLNIKNKEMTYWFIFCKTDLLLQKQADGSYTIPCSEESPIELKPWTHVLNISPMEDGTEVKAFTIDTPVTDNPNYEMCGLRPSYYKLSRDLYLKAGKCHELIYWDQNTQFCGICGAPMKMSTDISKKCTQCGKSVWPSLATAIIVLIRRGEEVLLVHARNFKSDFYGLVAGFVETGETLEQAVHREVMEETGLTINHLKYFGSQPWPYPSGLMVGFTADYVDGEIHLQKEELSRGKWFTKYNLPTIPEKLSIARQIIDAWLEEQKSNL
ncbi:MULTISPECIES: NAD(+) diphosphatase [Prevotellaceae]|uniref:NAD(+) diphosphatase n=3 Tax=Prevotellaceae TaxID=171552 RepID=UPI0023EBA0C6|nr:NAD(+) diphosphatase [Prevotella sp. B2-R-102]MDF4242182.1 NAD(+) diphosphatase [Prevotella sp. B2-R-102]